MSTFHQAQDWLETLYSEAKFFRHNEPPSLEVVEQILDALDRPDLFFEWRVIVGGTAGKGTVCRLTEDVLLRQGKSVALISSPHIQVPTERIRINGQLIKGEDFGKAVLEIQEVSTSFNIQPTYYEAIVLAGILAAKDAGVEVLILEVGMGGRLDGVNAVQGKRIAALTFVGHDHLEKFEGNIEKLAEEKAGIFTKDSVLNLSFEQKYCSILEKNSSSEITFIKGITSKMNKKIARKMCEKILDSSDFEMQKLKLPFSWETLTVPSPKLQAPSNKKIILDGAHSEPRFEYISPKIKKLTGPKILIAGMTKNHNFESFRIILDQFDEVIWTSGTGEREFWTPKELQQKFDLGSIETNAEEALKKALEMNGHIVITGSFYLCGEIRELFYPSEEIMEQRTEFPLLPHSRAGGNPEF